MSHPGNQDQGVAELSGSTYYPPPPPGPPPLQGAAISQDQHPQQTHLNDQHTTQHQQASGHATSPPQYAQQQQQAPYFPPPPGQDEKPSQQQHAPAPYSIPHYDPARPVASNEPGSGAFAPYAATPGQAPGHSHQAHSPQPPPAEAEKKSSWGGRFKSMLSAGAAAPINSLAHKLGSQSFLPETLDKECDKASAILRSFCAKGIYTDSDAGRAPTSVDAKAGGTSGGGVDPKKEKTKSRVIVTIPPKVIAKAVGLAIFTTFRAGFHVSGATGSGILIARLPDGSWSPPSGIQVHTLGGGFQIGLDIYDCVCVINSQGALAAFMNTRVSLGSDLAVVAGPFGAGGAVDIGTAVQRGREDGKKQPSTTSPGTASGVSQQPGAAAAGPAGSTSAGEQDKDKLKPGDGESRSRSRSSGSLKPVFSYVKSRGFYAGIQVDGTVVVERKDANAAFYGAQVTVQQVLRGQVPARGPQGMWPDGARGLLETLRGAEAGALHRQQQAQQQGQKTAAPASHVGAESAPPGYSAPAESLSGAPPAYVEDGSHAQGGGDVKYS